MKFFILVKCYYELSKRLGIALLYEENKSGYLSKEMKSMLKIHDEVASVEEQENSNKKVSAFDLILKEVVLAQCLKNVILADTKLVLYAPYIIIPCSYIKF